MTELRQTGAYATPDGVPKTQLSVVAYLDILGFTQEIRAAHNRAESDALLKRFTDVIGGWYGPGGVMHDRFSAEKDGRRQWEVKAFTDNVVLAHPIRYDPDGEAELGSAFSDISLFQIDLAHHGLFLRGGVAVGELYADEGFVFGVGLLDAYAAEQTAGSPRVVLADSAVEYSHKHLSYYGAVKGAPRSRALLIDEDKRWIVNYLTSVWPERTEPPLFDWLEKHRDVVSEKLQTFATDSRVLPKYLWAGRYHNYFCQHLPGGEDYMLDLPLSPLALTRLEDDPETVRRHALPRTGSTAAIDGRNW